MFSIAADRLGFLLGSFSGSDLMYPSEWAEGGPAISTSTAAPELQGDVVVQRYTQHRDGDLSFEIMAIWMADPTTNELLFYGFDSAGFAPDPPARGAWVDNDLVLDRVTPRGSSRLVITPSPEGWAWSKWFRGPDTERWTPVFDAVFTRNDDAADAS